ncbi:hypothetical protein KTO58_20145 [Chitinophaga pendula]|uniref:S41 family peptidase n=1 Tax=Chitinophaga TaxID=79328 RepID=UPI0012FD5825|nr:MULTISPECIES: S41 family peptidase [Chitinophaga]UCJ05979.1 hypothetical protein KTO58_20145 [Chitinophaga pendula]
MRKRLTSSGAAIFPLLFLSAVIFTACKKDSKSDPQPGNPDPVNNTAKSDEDSLKYLMYRTMQVSYVSGGRSTTTDLPSYYWYTQVPAIDPFSATYAKAEDLLSAMINKVSPTDRYSFLDRTGSLANKLQNGISQDAAPGEGGSYGMEVTYALDQSNKSHLMVLYTDKNGPASAADIQRGAEITAINGDANIAYDNGGPISQKVYAAIHSSKQVTLTVRKPKATATVTIPLTSTSFKINPILFDNVSNVGGRQVGYFSFYTFSSIYGDNDAPTNTKQVLDQLFAKFKAAGIQDLIVDLRYNGGGAVVTAEYLDNAIAPASAGGQVMYNFIYNNKLTANLSRTGLESVVKFDGTTGGLNLTRVFFITSGSTASASELTLQNLKPYMNVILVGDKTYGKPVGFIPFTLSIYKSGQEKYMGDLYAINFETKNARQEGGYFTGIDVNKQATDFVNVPWGDAQDEHLQQIYSYINTGAFKRDASTERVISNPDSRKVMSTALPSGSFNGMIDYRQRGGIR